MLPCYCLDLQHSERPTKQNSSICVFRWCLCVCADHLSVWEESFWAWKMRNRFEPCSPSHFNYKKRLHLSSSSLNQTFTRNCVLKKCIYFSFSNECFSYSCGSEEVHGRIGGRKKPESMRFKIHSVHIINNNCSYVEFMRCNNGAKIIFIFDALYL